MADKFISNSTVTYDIASNGETTVTFDLSIQNQTSEFYATSYTLSLNGINPVNPVAYEGNQALPVKITKEDSTYSINVSFPDDVVGKGNKRQFNISFEDKSLTSKQGEIWEITTPRLGEKTSFDFYSTVIKIPDSFGNLAYVSPSPSFKEESNGKMVFSFDKSASMNSAISIAFGKFQVFSFNLTYHLENPLNENVSYEIALPPDTNFQKVNYKEINPRPQKINIDQDGNWIASFQLKPHEKVDVKAKGAVQLFASAQEYPKTNLRKVTNDLAKTNLWQTDDPKIVELAKKLKTPRAIYDYVRTYLSYDYSRVAPNVERLGASLALENPKNAICTEFTDLFIAIARAAGIPTREIEGYAYTDNPQIQPLSLVADVLHAWPEYWDESTQNWIPIDPTWGATSGIDYFNKLDLRHFAFVIHGADPKKPYPAGSYKESANPQKDIEVAFGQLPGDRNPKLEVENKIISQIPFSDEIFNMKITNNGPVAVYNENFELLFDGQKSKEQKIDVIPPFSYYETKLTIPYSFLGQKTPSNATILVNGEKKSEFATYKPYVTISNLLMLCLFVFFIISMIYLKFKDAKAKKYS